MLRNVGAGRNFISMYIYMYTYIYIGLYMYMYVYMYMCICTCMCMCMCMYVSYGILRFEYSGYRGILLASFWVLRNIMFSLNEHQNEKAGAKPIRLQCK